MGTQIPGAPPAPPAAGMPGTSAEGAVNAGAGAGGAGAIPMPSDGADQAGGGGGGQQEMVKQTLTMLRMIDKALASLIDLYADNGGDQVTQARELLQQGTSKWVAQFGGAAPSISSTDTGPGFPGGGFNNGSVMPGG